MSKKFHYKVIFGTTIHIFHNIFDLVTSLPFLILTLVGNTIVSMFALVFYFLEHDINPKIHTLIDCFWWSFATATAVGYGDITPMTTFGKFLGIFLMLTGTALFATYTAFFAKAIMGEDFSIKRRAKEHSSE